MNEIIGRLSRKKYNASEAIRILSPGQVAFYWANGVEPLDIYQSIDYRNNKPILVGVFKRDETKEVYDKWMKSINEESN